MVCMFQPELRLLVKWIWAIDNITVAPNAVVTKNRKGNNLFLDGSPAEIKRENYPAWYVRDGEEYAEKVKKVEELKKTMNL